MDTPVHKGAVPGAPPTGPLPARFDCLRWVLAHDSQPPTMVRKRLRQPPGESPCDDLQALMPADDLVNEFTMSAPVHSIAELPAGGAICEFRHNHSLSRGGWRRSMETLRRPLETPLF